jgi:hypothetical protein
MTFKRAWLVVVGGIAVLSASSVALGDAVGLAAMRLDELGRLRSGVRTYQASSYARDGGNVDRGNYLYVDGEEHVMLDVLGPGCVYRIWMTGMDVDARIRIYFDGEAVPTVDERLGDFFSGALAPFLAPLTVNDDVSSGGFVSYVPLPFRTGCRITTSSDTHDYYNVTYQRYDSAAGIETFSGAEDTTEIRTAWDASGIDPKEDPGAMAVRGAATLAAGGVLTLADLPGAGVIQGLELILPGMDASLNQPVYDDGRAHRGTSAFEVAIDPVNAGVKLTRRLDYSIGNQTADVYVDGTYVGPWSTPGYAVNKWLDSTFDIPAVHTAGKDRLSIRIDFVSSDNDWNEFSYWVESLVGGVGVPSDELDVGDPDDEAAHGYSITMQTWAGDGTRKYYDPDAVEQVTDDGRAFKQHCQFVLAIDPANNGVNLTRRLDYTIADQQADVYVDGVFAGQWLTPGASAAKWLDSTFELPGSLTSGKSQILVKVVFTGATGDWNEFYYWAESIVGDVAVASDELDVGDAADEAAHEYQIAGDVWSGIRTFEYHAAFEPQPFFDVITQLRLVARWDGAAAAAIDVPIGGFFGSNIGPSEVRGLPAGIIGDRMYCWLPMPYAAGAQLELVSGHDADVDVDYRVHYTPQTPATVSGTARLHAVRNDTRPCIPGEDHIILDVTGAGHFVGVVQASAGDSLYYLEGDERIYVDGSLTPQLYGTGTEDFYNGGWYYNRGRFTRPTHGNPTMEGTPLTTDQYRFLISDLVPFSASLRVGIEHGGTNDTTDVDIWSVALFYKREEPLMTLSDALDVGNAASEDAHAYVATGQVSAPTLTDEYEGDANDVAVTDDGRHVGTAAGAGSSFTVAVTPCNHGVLLRRRCDYGVAHQEAIVYVNGAPAGIWYEPGQNSVHRWRDSEFMLPASLTRGAASLDIVIENVSATQAWTEYHYAVYALDWTGRVGELTGDSIVDANDLTELQQCFTGPNAPEGAPCCAPADADADGDVDLVDVAAFQEVFGA